MAEIVGYGMSGDAFHITQPAENGDGAYRVMLNTLKDAKVQPEQVGYINAHGTSTDIGDRLETVAIKRAFGDHAYKLAVSSTKSMTGHLLGGAGGLEAGVTVLALRDQILPPTVNLENPDPSAISTTFPTLARKPIWNTPCRILLDSAGPTARCCSGAGTNRSRGWRRLVHYIEACAGESPATTSTLCVPLGPIRDFEVSCTKVWLCNGRTPPVGPFQVMAPWYLRIGLLSLCQGASGRPE